jgi:hypothetical protein
MRPDEGGCADLRRSLAAPTKPVRSLTYDRRVDRVHAPGSQYPAEAQEAFSVAVAPKGLISVSARDDRDVTGRVVGVRHRPVLGDQTPYGHGVFGQLGLALFTEGRPGDTRPAAGGGDLDGLLNRRHVGRTGLTALAGLPQQQLLILFQDRRQEVSPSSWTLAGTASSPLIARATTCVCASRGGTRSPLSSP